MVINDKDGRPVLASPGGEVTRFTETLEWGQRLAETSVGVAEGDSKGLWNAKGWKEFVEHMPAEKQAVTAILLENCRQKFGRIDEVTRTSSLGTFDKWIFPVIANMSENDVIDQLVAVQPMAGPVSQIVYMDIVTGKAKGQVPAGTPMWRSLQGAVDRFDDSDELVSNESVGTTSGGNLSGVNLSYTPVRPGTVTLNVGGTITTDDSNGSFIATGAVASGTINYQTGAVVLTGSGSNSVTATYAFNSEGNLGIMDYEIKLTSTPVTAKVLKLKAMWSEEADQNLQSMYNIKAEPVLLNALTNALQYQKHRSVIYDLRNRAQAGVVTWDATPPASVNYQTHKFSIIDAFETASNFIYGATNMVAGNWILCGLQAATVVTTLPQFVAKNNRTQMHGITYLGDLGNKKVFADPHYENDEFLVGHKGDQFLVTGYVLGEYQKLYTTPNIVLPDFINQRGFATSFAKKMVNANMFARGRVLSAPVNFSPSVNL